VQGFILWGSQVVQPGEQLGVGGRKEGELDMWEVCKQSIQGWLGGSNLLQVAQGVVHRLQVSLLLFSGFILLFWHHSLL